MNDRWSEIDLANHLSANPKALRRTSHVKPLEPLLERATKYRNRKTEVNGESFDSKKEANRYQELLLLQRDGQISKLERQPRYEFAINGIRIGTYKPDFRYLDHDGSIVVEDVKSSASKTTAYRLRKRMMLAFRGLKVVET